MKFRRLNEDKEKFYYIMRKTKSGTPLILRDVYNGNVIKFSSVEDANKYIRQECGNKTDEYLVVSSFGKRSDYPKIGYDTYDIHFVESVGRKSSFPLKENNRMIKENLVGDSDNFEIYSDEQMNLQNKTLYRYIAYHKNDDIVIKVEVSVDKYGVEYIKIWSDDERILDIPKDLYKKYKKEIEDEIQYEVGYIQDYGDWTEGNADYYTDRKHTDESVKTRKSNFPLK